MERGKLCRMRSGPSGDYWNHQTWVNGRNVVRYVPQSELQALRRDIAGYKRFLEFCQAYADGVVGQCRLKRAALVKAAKRKGT